MTFNVLIKRGVVAVASSLAFSVLVTSFAEAATVGSFKFNPASSSSRKPSYDLTQDEIGTTASRSKVLDSYSALVSRSQKGADVSGGAIARPQRSGVAEKKTLKLSSSKAAELSTALSTQSDSSDSSTVEVDNNQILSGKWRSTQAFNANRGLTLSFSTTDPSNSLKMKGVEGFHYADGTDVPEPLTVIATLIGGSAVIGMRKKLASSDRSKRDRAI